MSRRTKRFIVSMIALIIPIIALAGCGGKKTVSNPIATITMEDGSTIKIELYPDKAPNTVANFVTLIQDGFYDGTTFHRLVPGFVIQGGDPDGNGTGGPGYSIAGEFSSNKFAKNDIAHVRGVLSMARSGHPDSAGSQFFICVDDCRQSLDGKYAAFGKVVDEESMKTVDAIVALPNSGYPNNKALKPPVMKSVTVDTQGVTYSVKTIK